MSVIHVKPILIKVAKINGYLEKYLKARIIIYV